MAIRDWRFRTVAILLVFGLAACLTSEWAYRSCFRRELAALMKAVVANHPNRLSLSSEYGRFQGHCVRKLKPSLLQDVIQGLRRKLNMPSELHATADPATSGIHPYYCVHFDLTYPDRWTKKSITHVFIWSPRELRFVHRATDGDCPHACPWTRAPER